MVHDRTSRHHDLDEDGGGMEGGERERDEKDTGNITMPLLRIGREETELWELWRAIHMKHYTFIIGGRAGYGIFSEARTRSMSSTE